MDLLHFHTFHSTSIILSYVPAISLPLFLLPLAFTPSPLPICSIMTNHTSCWFLFLCRCVSSPLSFSSRLVPSLSHIYQGMRSLGWWLWGPYMRLHRSNRRTTALSCRTSPCRTLSRASSVPPDPSASKSSMSESPSNFILPHIHNIQYQWNGWIH